MFQPGDVCIVNQEASNVLVGLYRSLIGKRVIITSLDTVNDKYPIQVLNPDPEKRWENSPHLQMRKDLLTKEWPK